MTESDLRSEIAACTSIESRLALTELALARFPSRQWSILARGRALLAAEGRPKAVSFFKDQIASNPRLAAGHLGITELMLESGEPGLVLEYCSRVKPDFPGAPWIQTREAAAFSQLGEWQSAALAWAKVVERRPANSVARGRWSHALRHLGEYAQAAEVWAGTERHSKPIFQIGFNKCGTSSLFHFFASQGCRSLHWDEGHLALAINSNVLAGRPLLAGFEDIEFFSDMEGLPDGGNAFICIYQKYFRELDSQYPDAKFILNTRNKDDWLQSRLSHDGATYIEWWKKATGMSRPQIIKKWSEEWDQHHRDVVAHFAGSEKKLLVFDIDRHDGSRLAEFFADRLDLDPSYFETRNATPR